MAILFLHCSIHLPVFPGLAGLLEEIEEPTVIVVPGEMADAQPEVHELFDRVIAIPGSFIDFIDSTEVEVQAFRAHEKDPFSRVVVTGEVGVLRGARLREALGIPGQSLVSALAYRDKVLMKSLCARAGVRVPRYKAIDGPSDLYAFVRSVGLPIVLKPRAGAGSIDTKLIRTEEELSSAFASMRAATVGLSISLIAEEFVNGQLYHVNGYATAEGEVRLAWPACYLERGNLDVVLNQGAFSGDCLLDPDDAQVARMSAFTKKCLRALPWPADGFAFHLELFKEDETSELILCEVACRQGGGTINDIYECAFGLHLLAASLRLQAGLPIPVHSAWPGQIFGGVQAPVPKGTLHLSSSEPPPFPWVERNEMKLKSGDKGSGRRSCVDSSANFVVRGESTAQVRSRLQEVIRWRESVATWTT